MIIKKIAFGDNNKAFIEQRLTSGLNVIYSDDNNRGKTLVMQGAMYSLGYDSIFPSSFNYKEKYFYSKIEIDNKEYELLRKRNSIVIKTDGSIQVFNSIGDFKYFFDKYIHSLPRIQKNSRKKTVDLSLLYELFFIGQDNRNPSGLISKGQFNKVDYKNMVYSLAGLFTNDSDELYILEIKNKIESSKIKLKEVRKKITLIKSNPEIAEIFSKLFDSERVQAKIKSIKELNERISKLKRSRLREINRKAKLELLISELNSLNIGLSEGDVRCGECGSDKIFYSNNDLTFEISNTDVRSEILKSISESISQKNEIIHDHTSEINQAQVSLSREMRDSPPNFQKIIVYQEQVDSENDFDDEAFSISQEIGSLKSQLTRIESISSSLKEDRKELDKKILGIMTKLYKSIDWNGNLEFHDIFTKNDSTFSGSEEQEFYFCKIVALNEVLKHDFPIMIDSFRDGELSTSKEDRMLQIYGMMNKQVILTATLKDEEYKSNKYKSNIKINAIDYSSHSDCKILTKDSKDEFSSLLENFHGIVI